MEKKKRIMLLGGIRYLLPAIEAAHRRGLHVITVDFLPDNIAHRYSDEYHNVSIIDKEAVLKLARDLQIDGILSFAVDPGVVSAAYVAEQMGLPFQCSYKTACILQDKALFRRFLSDHGFNAPTAKGYSKAEDAIADVDLFHWPVIVKPVDSAGSKGVTRVDRKEQLQAAITHALECSPSRQFIVEDFLEKVGLSSGAESFFVNGRLMYNGFYDQFFDDEAVNPFTPSAECWPAAKDESILDEVRKELQRLGDLLGLGTGLFNVEWRVCADGKAYLMEVSPRAGGNRLAEMLLHAADVDIIDAEVAKAVGEPMDDIHEPTYSGHYTIFVLHSDRPGTFVGLQVDEEFRRKHIIEEELRIAPGEKVAAFTGANTAIGTLFLRFESHEEMMWVMENVRKYVKIMVNE